MVDRVDIRVSRACRGLSLCLCDLHGQRGCQPDKQDQPVEETGASIPVGWVWACVRLLDGKWTQQVDELKNKNLAEIV